MARAGSVNPVFARNASFIMPCWYQCAIISLALMYGRGMARMAASRAMRGISPACALEAAASEAYRRLAC